MKKLFTIFTLLALLAIACKKSVSTIPTYHVNPALKSGFNFKIGTYWIYKDSISGMIDSLYVYYHYDYNSRPLLSKTTTPMSDSVEDIVMYMTDTNIAPLPINNRTNVFAFELYADLFNLQFDEGVKDTSPDTLLFIRNSQIMYQPLFNYPYLNPIIDSSPYYNTRTIAEGNIIGIYSNFGLSNSVYNNVAEINHTGCYIRSLQKDTCYYNDRFYVSPGTGIIKMSFNHPKDTFSRVWELQRCNIVK